MESKLAIIDEFPEECEQCIARKMELIEKCPIDGRAARHTWVHFEAGYAFGCTKKKTLVQGAKTHQAVLGRHEGLLRTLASYKNALDAKYDSEYKRLLHNIEGHDAHIIQEFQDIATENDLSNASGNHREFIAGRLRGDTLGAARSLLKMFQSAIGIKTEIIIYQRLYLDRKWTEQRKKYRVHAVLMNTAYKFFEDFTEKNILLKVGKTYEDVYVDYECISIVLYHLLDNAQKYALKSHDINVDFRVVGTRVEITFDMMSTAVETSEEDKIFHEGYSGENAKKTGKKGQGYGMAIIRDIVSRTGYSFLCEWNYDKKRIVVDNVPYTRNRIHVGLPRADK